jgi:putative phosphoesterase
MTPVPTTRIGVISDTHGRMHPRVFELLEGVDHILHAGDIGTEDVLIELRAIAPVTAVRGNVDELRECGRYPEEAEIALGGLRLHLVHQVAPLKARLEAGAWDGPPPDVVVYGHSHMGKAERVGTTLLFNPGSAGPRRFRTVPSVGRLTVQGGRVTAELVALDPQDQPAIQPIIQEALVATR